MYTHIYTYIFLDTKLNTFAMILKYVNKLLDSSLRGEV